MNYHKLRLENLKETWDRFGRDMGLGELEPILVQTVLDNVLDLLIEKHTTKDCSKSSGYSGSSSSQIMESTL